MNRRIRYLIEYLNKHTALYDAGVPEISDQEWDKFYFELHFLCVGLAGEMPLFASDTPQTQRYEKKSIINNNRVTFCDNFC